MIIKINFIFLVTNKWQKVEIEGPPPACRLDFGACAVRLSVPAQPSDNTPALVASRLQAKEVIDSQRLGSADSVRSMASGGSAGSQRSITSLDTALARAAAVGAIESNSRDLSSNGRYSYSE